MRLASSCVMASHAEPTFFSWMCTTRQQGHVWTACLVSGVNLPYQLLDGNCATPVCVYLAECVLNSLLFGNNICLELRKVDLLVPVAVILFEQLLDILICLRQAHLPKSGLYTPVSEKCPSSDTPATQTPLFILHWQNFAVRQHCC